ncbi:hypothetical protein SDC9_163691 [bioreactor metagenome]|uniref:Uncharacterized protein n=1 Tax=bioreactor metagenome TaxID=1076179 RepID=A0A645FRV7_9ZZZZ
MDDGYIFLQLTVFNVQYPGKKGKPGRLVEVILQTRDIGRFIFTVMRCQDFNIRFLKLVGQFLFPHPR